MATPSDPNISDSFLHQLLHHNPHSEELRELIISLPKEKGWLTQDMYNYRGFWFESFILQGIILISSQQHFQAQDSDIILCSLPKCGTTWLKALTYALITRKQYFPVSQETHPLLTKNPHDLIPSLEISYARENSPSLSLNNGQRVLATHLPYSLLPKSVWESKCKLIYVGRNPKDALVSYWHFMNKLRGEVPGLGDIPFPEAYDKYCRGVSQNGPFWDHALEYWKASLENPRKVLFLKYEEIKEEAGVQLRQIAAFLECPFSEEEEGYGVVGEILRLCSFESLSNLEVNRTEKSVLGVENGVLFRKGNVGDWRNHLSDEMASRLDQIVEEKFTGTGLKF